MMILDTLETGAAKVNLTTDLRNIIHQINPNDLLCAYKPTFEKWATRTLLDLDTVDCWEEKADKVPVIDSLDDRETEERRSLNGRQICFQDFGRQTDKAVAGWEVCLERHSAAATTYQRDLGGVRINRNRRAHSSPAVEKLNDSRANNGQDKSKMKIGLYPTRSTVHHDNKIRDYGEERASPFQRNTSPPDITFKHYDSHRQHMDQYREKYTYMKIRSQRNQYVRNAFTAGLRIQHPINFSPLRSFDTSSYHFPGITHSVVTTNDEKLASVPCPVPKRKFKCHSPHPQQQRVEDPSRERKHIVSPLQKTVSVTEKKKQAPKAVASEGFSPIGNRAGVINVEFYNHHTLGSTSKKEMSKILLNIPIMVCRTRPTIPSNAHGSIHPSALGTSNSYVIPRLRGSDSSCTQKK